MRRALVFVLSLLSAAAGLVAASSAEDAPFPDRVVEFKPGEGAGYGQKMLPKIVLGPPYGRGKFLGGGDVLSLGAGGSITLEFTKHEIIDGEGPDFIVFENAFLIKPGVDPDKGVFEHAKVEVSADGKTWKEFPHDAAGGKGCAGRAPVYYNPDTLEGRSLDVQDPKQAGGDAFDLAEVKLKSVRFIRITDLDNAEGKEGTAGFDLDAVVGIHTRARKDN